MKIMKELVTTIVVIVVIGTLILGILAHQRTRDIDEFAGRFLSREGSTSALTIEELRAAIRTYERRLEKHVADASKTAIYWKLLSSRLMDRGLHGEALEALERAIYYSPEDPVLHCYTGISAGIMAKSIHMFPGRDNRERENYFAIAERAYRRAIELDGRYLRSLYGLSVLYVFELNRPEDAIPYLRRYLEISRNDVDAMFVLARAHFMTRDFQAALDIYDRIITLTGDEQKRRDAHDNRQLVIGQMYG